MKKALPLMLTILFLTSCASNIHQAVKSQNMEKIKYFVEQGQINEFNMKAERAGTHWASSGEDRESGHTPLMIACYYGYVDIALYLCENGADLNAQNGNGDTALIFATYYNFPAIVEVLIEHGVFVNQKDRYGHTALYYAERNYHPRIMKDRKTAGGVYE